jgi:hypothetical protein
MQATVQNPIVATGLNIIGDVYNDLEKLTIDELVFGIVGDLAIEAIVEDQTIANKRLKVFRDIFNDQKLTFDELDFHIVGKEETAVQDKDMEGTVQDQTIAAKGLNILRDIFNGHESISYDATILREALNNQELILVQQLLEYW